MAKDRPLSKQEITELQRKLSMMSVTAISDFYFSSHFNCKLKDGKAPEARHIQELGAGVEGDA